MQNFINNIINTSVNGNEDSDAHLMSLFGIALSLRPKKILELGVRQGTTTLPLLLATYLTGGRLTSVDINDTSFLCPQELEKNWQFIKSDAIKFLENQVLENIQYDVVFVDDWHSYNHVKKELELIENLVTSKSIVLLHDLMYDWKEPNYHSERNTSNPEWADGGPFRAVNELDKTRWEFATIPRSNGLTLLRKLY